MNMSKDIIKEYAIYLKEQLSLFTQGGNILTRLDQFIQHGRMKDGISVKSTDKTKIAVLNEMANNIRFFIMNHYKLFGKDVRNVIMTYDEFSVPVNRNNKLKELGIDNE